MTGRPVDARALLEETLQRIAWLPQTGPGPTAADAPALAAAALRAVRPVDETPGDTDPGVPLQDMTRPGYRPPAPGADGGPICADCHQPYPAPVYYSTETGSLCPPCAGPYLEPDAKDDPRRPAPPVCPAETPPTCAADVDDGRVCLMLEGHDGPHVAETYGPDDMEDDADPDGDYLRP